MATYLRAVACASLFIAYSIPVFSQSAPTLGTSGSYAALAGSTVTNTGPTSVSGDVGVSPGTAITGFPPGVVLSGSMHSADAAALQAQSDLTAAYASLAGQACTTELTGQDLGGLTLTAGVYCFSSSAQLTGTLTLDAQGDPAALFIFQIGSALTTASGSKVIVINGGSNCNAFWQVGSSAVLGTTTSFAGNILALTSISLDTDATINGRLLARNGAVTLQSNTAAVCSAACAAISVSPTALPTATVGVAYNQTITATGAVGPYSFSVTSGTVPAGLNLSAAGVLSGIATSAGSFSFGVTVTGAGACIGIQTMTVIVSPSVVTGTPATVPTLSPWALILMLFVTLGVGLSVFLKR